MITLPVVVMSFDRYDYLEGVLQSLLRQSLTREVRLEPMLFQDGANVPGSDDRVADPVALTRSVATFRRYFPSAPVFETPENLGVAKNFDRAERYVFVTKRHPFALFLEDDMLLAPHYVDAILRMLELAHEVDYIGMVSGYGYKPNTPLSVQRANRHELCLMNEHNWAFALMRGAWLRREEIVSEYLQIIGDVPYRDRQQKRDEIEAFYARYGKSGKGYMSSQDSVKNMALEVLGIHRVSTWTNNARYIGRRGLHMTADRFQRRGYDQTVMYPDPVDYFRLPTKAELSAQRKLA
jgi:hypothetical protein